MDPLAHAAHTKRLTATVPGRQRRFFPGVPRTLFPTFFPAKALRGVLIPPTGSLRAVCLVRAMDDVTDVIIVLEKKINDRDIATARCTYIR
jgi:hypothetical protein